MTDIATRTPAQEVVQKIRGNDFANEIRNALPAGVSVERFRRVTITAINQNPDIAKGDQWALLQAVIQCAQVGLMPDGREAALVSFGGKAVFMPMIGGFRKIAAEHGWAIDTHVVYENDTFEYELGLNPVLVHKPPRLDVDRGAKIGAYAVCTHSDGRKQVEVMGREDIMRVKAVSKQPNGQLWTTWENRAWEKTVGRRAFAKLPKGGSDERVSRLLEASDAEYELDGPPEERAVARSLTAAIPADHLDGPDDTPDEVLTPTPADVTDPSPASSSSTFTPPKGPRGGAK